MTTVVGYGPCGDGYLCPGLVDGEGDGFEAGDEVEDAAVCGGKLLQGLAGAEGDRGFFFLKADRVVVYRG